MREYVSHELGQAIKDARKKANLTQIELASEIDVSPGTISNIENASRQVESPILEKVCIFLGIDKDSFNDEVQIDSSSIDIYKRAQLIEIEMEYSTQEASEELRRFEEERKYILGKEDIMSVFSHYLKGKIADKNRSYEKALAEFNMTLRLAKQLNDSDMLLVQSSNIISSCHYWISRIYHRQNKLYKGLELNEQGFEYFNPKGDRTFIFYLLCINKASILEKLNQDADALKVIEEIWNHRAFMRSSDIELNMYQIRVEILIKHHRYQEAIDLAQKGLHLARLDRNEDRKFELLSSLGEAHAKLGELSVAKLYYQYASKLEGKIRKKYLATTTYTQLGKIQIQQGNYAKAKEYLDKAVEIGKDYADFRLCRALLTLGECHFRQGNHKESHKVLEQSLELCKKLGLDQYLHEHLILLADISFRSKKSGYEHYIDILLRELVQKMLQGGAEMVAFVNDPPDD